MVMRYWLMMLLAMVPGLLRAEDQLLPAYPRVEPGVALHFPADHGAHPAFRTEWWYITGWLKTEDGRDLGFQVTFFRTRPLVDQNNPSKFNARQVIFAHAALSDPKQGRLLHDQRIARQGFGLVQAAQGNLDVSLDDWTMLRDHDGRVTSHISGTEFTFDLSFTPTQEVVLQGDKGVSGKGPQSGEASYYYSIPHLQIGGRLRENGAQVAVSGEAWLDHEWSSDYLDPQAVGWDWLGVNLDDGGALTAFRIRDAAGNALWAGGSLRKPDGTVRILRPLDVRFTALRQWRSPHTGALYPVQWRLDLGADGVTTVTPLFDDQELDSRSGGGPVYWEGAVRLADGLTGKGYLELTGYLEKLKL
jgi:predicted secreted hydrolase